MGMPKVAVVTPYHTETEAVLMRCRDSVNRQTYPCTHVMVADGHARPVFDRMPGVLHVTLPVENGDYGNTPRAIGGLLAESYGFDAIAWLDADNWYDIHHIEKMAIKAAEFPDTQLVSCRRRFYDTRQTDLGITEADEDMGNHVDTNCWFVLRSAFSLLRFWLLPKSLAAIGDRLLFGKVVHDQFRRVATQDRTVCYQTLWASHYIQAGLPPPSGAKHLDTTEVMRFVHSAEGVAEVTRVLGFYPTFR
jgi:hypothetical protein